MIYLSIGAVISSIMRSSHKYILLTFSSNDIQIDSVQFINPSYTALREVLFK